MSLPPPPPLPAASSTVFNISKPDNNPEDVAQVLKKWMHLEGLEGTTFVAGWRDVHSVLQNGPQCGLVALCMAAQSLSVSISTEAVFSTAVDRKLTKQGEMFSASAMVDLAHCFNLKSKIIESGLSDIRQVLELLMEGKFLLVPYDADRDHRPCLKKGHKAHWALLFGYLMKSNGNSSANYLSIESNLHKINGKSESILGQDIEKASTYLLAKHGKSKWTAVWNYQQLEQSNLNLEEVDPQRRDDQEYVLPAGASLTKELCGKIICISRDNI